MFYISTSHLIQKAEEPKGNFLIDTYLKVICGNESIFNTYEDWVVYDMKRWDSEENVFIDEFKLIDKRHDIDLCEELSESEQQELGDWLRTTLEESYFIENRSPDEIYEKCCSDFDDYIKPIHLLTVLQERVDSGTAPTIRRVEHKGGAYYIGI